MVVNSCGETIQNKYIRISRDGTLRRIWLDLLSRLLIQGVELPLCYMIISSRMVGIADCVNDVPSEALIEYIRPSELYVL